MQINPIVYIIIAAIAGYLVGILDRWFTQTFVKKREKTPPPVAENQKEQNVAGEHTVLKVTVDPALKWHVELDGSRLEDPAALIPEQRQRMVNVVVQMRPWIDGKPAPAAVPAPVPAPIPASPAPAPRPVPVSQLAPEIQPQRQLPAAMPAAQAPAAPPPPPKIDPVRGLRTMLKNEVKSPDQMKSLSIVAMIDSVLQAKIPGTPFAGKGIRLEEGSLGEVIVYVGASRYPGIDAVPDPDVQALIRAAIADWEKK